MLALIILISAAILGAVIALVTRPLRPPPWLFVISVMALFAGVSLTLWGTSQLSASLGRIHTWRGCDGVVVSSDVVGERAFHVALTYEYAVDGEVFRDTTSLRQPSFGGKNKRYDVALKLLAEYPPGSEIPVLYNPADPSQSTVNTHVFWSVYGQTGFGGVLVIFAVAVGVMFLRNRHHPSADSPVQRAEVSV